MGFFEISLHCPNQIPEIGYMSGRVEIPKNQGWLQLDSRGGLVYRKEAIPLGDWAKVNPDGDGIRFSTVRDTLQHWANSVSELKSNGIAIPLATSHEDWEDTQNRLGEVVGAIVKKNSSGVRSLFLDIRFTDKESRDQALKGDISIGSPPSFIDGRGRKYKYPLRHVASTSAPVIPGLETWQAIAAAFDSKGNVMEIDELIEVMGIEIPEEAQSDDAKKALVMMKLKETFGTVTDDPNPADDMPEEVEASQEEEEEQPTATPLQTPTSEQQPNPQPKKIAVQFAHQAISQNPLVVRTIHDARRDRIAAGVEKGDFSAAVGERLTKQYCNEKSIRLALSKGNDSGAFDQAIDLAILASKNRPLSANGRMDAFDDDSAVELGHGNDPMKMIDRAVKQYKESHPELVRN